jgi:enamine deaminase RidA (YjgF/YER057c/UK114 family)
MTGPRSRRTVVVVAAVVGGALFVAGCGGSNSDDYKKQVTNAAQQFQTDAQQAGTSLGGARSPTQFRAAAGEFKGAVTKFTDKLNSLDPPSHAKDEQDKLVNDLQHFSGTVNEISNKVQSATSGDPQGLVALVPQLQSDVQKVSKDAQDLQNAVNNS